MSKANPIFARPVPAFLRKYEGLLSVNTTNNRKSLGNKDDLLDDHVGRQGECEDKEKFLVKNDDSEDNVDSRPFTFVSASEANEEAPEEAEEAPTRVMFRVTTKKRKNDEKGGYDSHTQNKKSLCLPQKKSLLSFDDGEVEE
jgi:hypothetical protein